MSNRQLQLFQRHGLYFQKGQQHSHEHSWPIYIGSALFATAGLREPQDTGGQLEVGCIPSSRWRAYTQTLEGKVMTFFRPDPPKLDSPLLTLVLVLSLIPNRRSVMTQSAGAHSTLLFDDTTAANAVTSSATGTPAPSSPSTTTPNSTHEQIHPAPAITASMKSRRVTAEAEAIARAPSQLLTRTFPRPRRMLRQCPG